MPRQVPWLRIVAESVAIVASILLAFGIQAWWEQRQERDAEQRALLGLVEDFVPNLLQAGTLVENHRYHQRLMASLEARSRSELLAITQDSAGLYEAALMSRGTFDGRNGTLEALIGSGTLGVIRDETLRSSLASWLGLVDDIREEAEDHRLAANAVRRRVFELGGPWRGLRPGVARRAPPASLDALAEDAELMALTRGSLAASERYVPELERARDLAAEILEAIEGHVTRSDGVTSLAVATRQMEAPNVDMRGGFSATATLVDGSTRNVTHLAQWTSSDSEVLELTLMFGHAKRPGQAEVCAEYRNAVGCLPITVQDCSRLCRNAF